VAKTASTKKKAKNGLGMDQRVYPRLKPSAIPFLKSISFEKGLEAQVIDISRGGMLIETDIRLRPQMKLGINVTTTDGTIVLDGSVVRTFIVSLKGAPRYQSAIGFDHPFHMLEDLSENTIEQAAESRQEPVPAAQIPEKTEQPLSQAKADESPAKTDESGDDSAFLSLFADDTLEVPPLDKLNDW
jgi:hypothetical protein